MATFCGDTTARHKQSNYGSIGLQEARASKQPSHSKRAGSTSACTGYAVCKLARALCEARICVAEN